MSDDDVMAAAIDAGTRAMLRKRCAQEGMPPIYDGLYPDEQDAIRAQFAAGLETTLRAMIADEIMTATLVKARFVAGILAAARVARGTP